MKLLLDENVENALLRGLLRLSYPVDVVRVIDVELGGQSDPEVLAWAASQGRVLVSRDHATMGRAAISRIQTGQAMPGLLLLRLGVPLGKILNDLALIVQTATPGDLQDRILYIPL